MQIPIMNGIFTNDLSDFRTSYPVNLIPVPKVNGISSGYLRPAEGINLFSKTSGLDRGGINWNGSCFRVCGSDLIKVYEDGTFKTLGIIDGDEKVSFTYSFDYLAIAGGGKLYLYKDSELKQVTDGDLGVCNDVIYIDGYFMSTDGSYMIVTELNDPFSVNPLKYGSAEVDPDPINALVDLRNEVYALGRYTIEVFSNVGGDNFPFSRVDGAMTPKGILSKTTYCMYMDTIAFVGSTKNEPVSIYLLDTASAKKISNREIDQILHSFTEKQLSECILECRNVDGHNWLYFHLPNQTIVYDYAATVATNENVWFILSSGLEKDKFTARNFVWCYDKWIVGHTDKNELGVMTYDNPHHWGEVVGWEFATTIIYNESRGALFRQLELVSLTGNVELGKSPTISTRYSLDGETWSQYKFIRIGKIGERSKRLVWFNQGNMKNWRIQKFNGTSECNLSFARLEAQLEPLAV